MRNDKTTLGPAAAPELLIRLDRAAPEPLRAQLERELRTAIRAGRLQAGTELPSTRALAADLGLSRGIVVEAYEQLLAEGYLTARRGSATTVAPGRAGASASASASAGAMRPETTRPSGLRSETTRSGAARRDAAVARDARRARERGPTVREESRVETRRFDFRPAVPDTSTFPRRSWYRSLRNILASAAGSVMDYPDPRGTAACRSALAGYVNRARGAATQAERMVICSGFTQGFRLACSVLARHGVAAIATEDPSHGEQREAIRAAGLKVVPVPVDENGLMVDRLERSDARAVLVTPAHQYPTGCVLAAERRAALIAWARRRQAFVIEDDYDAEFRYDREPIGALQGVAPERVIYIGSASKTLAPALRLGWLALPDGLVADFARAKKFEDRGSPTIEQLAFADFIERGELDRQLRRMRRLYRRRRDVLVAALRRHLPQQRVFGIAAGLHLMLELPADADEQEVTAAAAALSVNVNGTRDYCARLKARPALIIGYGSVRDSAIPEGIRRLAAALGRRTALTGKASVP